MITVLNFFSILYNNGINKAIGFFRRCLIKRKVKNILDKNFKVNTPFAFVQVGANDGVSFDFLHEFVILRKSSGVVIEPVKEYFDELVSNYSKFDTILKVNKAIHPTEKELAIYKINPTCKEKYPDWAKGIASFDPKHHEKVNIDSRDIITEKVACDSLMNIVKIKTIDYFQVDTEGFDYEVLKMIDFETIKPSIIKYEHASLSNDDSINAQKLLQKNGYHLFLENNDTIGISCKKIRI